MKPYLRDTLKNLGVNTASTRITRLKRKVRWAYYDLRQHLSRTKQAIKLATERILP